MSTKTTLKRIALATVAALGIGLTSSLPSSAVNADTARFTTGITLNTSYLTVVENGTNGYTDSAGYFYFDVSNESVATSAQSSVGLIPNHETVTITVVESPSAVLAAPAVMPITFETVTATDDANALRLVRGSTNNSDTFTATSGTGFVMAGDTITASESLSFSPTTALSNSPKSRYAFLVRPGSEAGFDAGYFKLRIRVNTADATIIDKFIWVRFVSVIQDAGASVAISVTGSVANEESVTFATNNKISATLRGATNSDRILIGVDFSDGDDSPTVASTAPTLNAAFLDDGDLASGTSNVRVRDTGVDAVDHVAPTAAVNAASDAQEALFASYRALADGVYGVTADKAPTLSANSDDIEIRVRVSNTDVSSTAAVAAFAARSSITTATVQLDAEGVAAADLLVSSALTAGTDTTVDKAYTLPLTATTATLTIDGASAANKTLTTKVTWSGNWASSSVTPATLTTLSTLANSDGEIERTITNSAPVAGAVATVTITGFADGGQLIVTLTWAASAVNSVTIVEPVDNVKTVLKGTTDFAIVVKDQFGNPMAGEQLQPSLQSATVSANYSASVTYPVITTNASGIATWSLTDAAATTVLGDSVKFTSVSVASKSDTHSVSYVATAPVVASFLTYYDESFTQASASVATSVPATGIYTSTGAKHSLKYDINLSKDISSVSESLTDALIKVRARALTSAGVAATGASVTVTAGEGGHIVGLDGLPTSSRTFGVPTNGDVVFQALATKSGAISWTITSGSTSSTVSLWVADPTGTAARTIAISGDSSGTANDAGVPMTVTVTDRYGNPVSEVLLTLVSTGVGSFAGGATTQSYTTDATGSYSFMARSNVSGGGVGTFKATIATAGTAASSIAGYHNATKVDSTLSAGVASATATVTFAAGEDPASAAATAASDAALEAIDAANAATDAANLAAEAADAATVAAEEARDAADAATAAVEALASEVSTLIAGLKAQITTLAKTVAKIAKKVKA